MRSAIRSSSSIARASWTEAAYNEYGTAVAFSEMLGALLAAKPPIDLIGMASDFMADEVLHVELTSRIAMELGGGAPYEIDFDGLGIHPSLELSPLQRANQLVVHVCCVGEAFSLPMLASAYISALHPLTKQVLQRIVHDEAPHGRFGFLYLDWATEQLDVEERARLGHVAVDTISQFAPLWQRLTSRVHDGITTEGFQLEHVRELQGVPGNDATLFPPMFAAASGSTVLNNSGGAAARRRGWWCGDRHRDRWWWWRCGWRRLLSKVATKLLPDLVVD